MAKLAILPENMNHASFGGLGLRMSVSPIQVASAISVPCQPSDAKQKKPRDSKTP